MSSPLICARDSCDNVCGRILPSTRTDPEEVLPWDESLMDDNGSCYCSRECMTPETEGDEE